MENNNNNNNNNNKRESEQESGGGYQRMFCWLSLPRVILFLLVQNKTLPPLYPLTVPPFPM